MYGMRFFAFIVPPINCNDKMQSGKLVVKVWILALLLLAPFTSISCGGDELPEVDPTDVIAAADSAGRALVGELAIVRDTANLPSIYFDTIYRYYAAARLIEREKRHAADSLVKLGVLAIDNVKTPALRQNGRQSLYLFLHRDSVLAVRRDSLSRGLRSALAAMLDSTTLAAEDLDELIAELTARHRFEPEWRTTLDSLTRSTVLIELEILNFLDSVGRRVQVDEVLKFTTANDMVQYQSLTTRLSEVAVAQQDLVDRITYGMPLPADSLGQKVDTPAGVTRQSPQSWPGAVRVQ